MNRRQFVSSILATGIVIAGIPAPELLKPLVPWDTWHEEFLKVYSDYMSNVLIFGIGAIGYIDEFPFVRSIPPQDIHLAIASTKLSDIYP